MPYWAALARALSNEDRTFAETRWTDAFYRLIFAGMLKALARAADKERGHRLEQ